MAKLAPGVTFEDAPSDRLFNYAGVDAIVTLDILRQMWPTLSATPDYTEFDKGVPRKVKVPSIASELINVKSKAVQFVVNMEVEGLVFDIEKNREMAAAMEAELNQLEGEIFEAIGRKINLASGPEVAKLLYVTYGLDCPKKTKGGEESVDDDALEMLSEKYPQHKWLALINRRKNVSSVYNSYVRSYVQDWVKRDGKVHPEYNLHGTGSHRISSNNPNMLALPRPDSCPPYDVRSQFIAPWGYVFVTFDFSSCEVKVLAARCRDPEMLKAIREGKDFHTYTASLINGLNYDEMHHVLESTKAQLAESLSLQKTFKRYKKLRQAAKAVTFGILYGSSVRAIALLLEITESEAQAIVDAYFRIYPGIQNFVNNCHKMAAANHYVYSPFGQRKMEFGTLPVFKRTAAYNAALRNSQNVSIQGPASTLGLLAFCKIDEELRKIGGGVACTVVTCAVGKPL